MTFNNIFLQFSRFSLSWFWFFLKICNISTATTTRKKSQTLSEDIPFGKLFSFSTILFYAWTVEIGIHWPDKSTLWVVFGANRFAVDRCHWLMLGRPKMLKNISEHVIQLVKYSSCNTMHAFMLIFMYNRWVNRWTWPKKSWARSS